MKAKSLSILVIVFLSTACAKFSYIMDQGRGQWRLLNSARVNQEILNDPLVPAEYKKKLETVLLHRDHFYRYWNEKPQEIYSKTTILDQEAVTYLVIASAWNKIEAHQECFPFVGCFPYLGFFSKDKAIEHHRQLQEQGLVTYIRPVYAYSSLGHFDDPILSSFFKYDDIDLARLVFHELFHSIFFIKNEVNLNEALANFVADKMLLEYFNNKQDHIEELRVDEEKNTKIKSVLVDLTKKLNQRYLAMTNKESRPEAQSVLDNFLKEEFRPTVSKMCVELWGVKTDCEILKGDWNNARFVAFMTYEEDQTVIEDYYRHVEALNKQPIKLVQFVETLRNQYDHYKKNDRKRIRFEEYLKAEVLKNK